MNNALSQLLKNKDHIFDSLKRPHEWNSYAAQFIAVGILGIAAYGAVMATYNPSWSEVWEFAWKMVATIWGPIAICTPSLYVFSAVRGSTITLPQLVYLLLGAVATSGIVLLAFAPITWFFTWTMDEIEMIRMMNVFLVALAIGFGLVFMQQGFISLEKEKNSEDETSAIERFKQLGSAASVLLVWFIVLLVVTAQMAHELGPWFNMPALQ